MESILTSIKKTVKTGEDIVKNGVKPNIAFI